MLLYSAHFLLTTTCFKSLLTQVKCMRISCLLAQCWYYRAKAPPEMTHAGVSVLRLDSLCEQIRQKAEQKAPCILQMQVEKLRRWNDNDSS